MSLLIKNAKVLIPNTPFNGKRVDILIEKGKIKSIAKKISVTTKHTIKSKNVCVSLGWLDIGVSTGEPGMEHRETLRALGLAALSGGYTGIAVLPNTDPIIQTKSSIQYFEMNKEYAALDYFPMAALSRDCHGEEITEYIDLSRAGAIAFTDGLHSVQDDGLMMRALQYSKATTKPIFNMPISASLDSGSHLHEGKVSTLLGLKGSPSLAEKLMVQRDIELVDYSDAAYVCHKISALESVKLIKEAKKRALKVGSTVSYNNLLFTDDDLLDFDSNLKVQPPLRTKKDQLALVRAVKDGTIDAIVSDHQPIEIEGKHLEFPYATPGAIGLQTCFGAMWKRLNKKISLNTLLEKLTIGPRSLLGLEIPEFGEGVRPNITIFDPSIEWELKESDILSKSKNSPWIDKNLQGKVLGVVNNGNFVSY